MKWFKNLFREKKLVVIDDLFPNLLSSFRIAEYNSYLQSYQHCEIFSTVADFDKIKEEYTKYYPEFEERVAPVISDHKFGCSLFYTVFLNNAYSFLPFFEKEGVPFVFTLYPGGGFWLNHDESDKKLQKICRSQLLQKIIVTQKLTYDYLLSNNFCSEDKIEFIYGVVLQSDYFQRCMVPKKYYKKEKETFDICFVAHKYMERGSDKGYDSFIEVAHRLIRVGHDIRFHVVGNFDAHDIDVSELKDEITFYGCRYSDFFPEFYSRMDIVLSPNIPFVFAPGKFDGFPTGACIEAGLNGVAVFCMDTLKMNNDFEHERDIYIIPEEIDGIVRSILEYYKDVTKLYELSNKGKEIFYSLFDFDRQMKHRLNVIDAYL